jgi:hypothetical protein
LCLLRYCAQLIARNRKRKSALAPRQPEKPPVAVTKKPIAVKPATKIKPKISFPARPKASVSQPPPPVPPATASAKDVKLSQSKMHVLDIEDDAPTATASENVKPSALPAESAPTSWAELEGVKRAQVLRTINAELLRAKSPEPPPPPPPPPQTPLFRPAPSIPVELSEMAITAAEIRKRWGLLSPLPSHTDANPSELVVPPPALPLVSWFSTPTMVSVAAPAVKLSKTKTRPLDPEFVRRVYESRVCFFACFQCSSFYELTLLLLVAPPSMQAKFGEHVARTAVCDPLAGNPWRVIETLSEQLLDEALGVVAADLAAGLDTVLESLVCAEVGGAG